MDIIPDTHSSVTPGIQDIYTSYISGHEGDRDKTRVIPGGYSDDCITSVQKLVLKPDGEFFSAFYPRIGTETNKGDTEPRRACLLRYLLCHFPMAEIRNSGGTEASFHVVLSLDDSVSRLLAEDRPLFIKLLQKLRLIAFCDKISDGLLSALSARAVSSINLKTGQTVTQIQQAGGVYSVDDLERIIERWFNNPCIVVFRSWFGIDGDQARCPFHDSADMDMKVGAVDADGGIVCFGGQHCSSGKKARRFQMVGKSDKVPTLAKLLIGNDKYLKRWSAEFSVMNHEYVELKAKNKAEEKSQRGGKLLITIDANTTDDQILEAVGSSHTKISNLYCDTARVLLTLEPNVATDELEMQRHDSVEKFISLVGRCANIWVKTSKSSRFAPLPHARASSIFHRPELRENMRVLTRVSINPVLDLTNLRVQSPGYDASTKVFYDGPVVTVRDDGQTPHLDKLLSGWTGLCGSPFKSCKTEADTAHMYAGVFTEILADSEIYTIHRHPAVRANQKGAGKDKYAEVLGILRDGETPVDLNHSDENRINQGFGNGIHAGRRIFQVTNISSSTTYENSMITRWLTSESLTGPKHGGGNWAISPNTASVILTINKGSIDHDLLDRLLPVNLEIVGNAKKRRFDFSPNDYVLGHRLEIIGEVMGLAILCLKENRGWNIPAGMDRRFDRWMKIIGALLERRGLLGFMENLEEVDDEIDEDKEAFVELARRIYAAKSDTWLRPKDIVPFCRTGGGMGLSSKQLFAEHVAGGSPERSLSKYVLARFVDETIRLPGNEGEPGLAVALRRNDDAKHKSVVFMIEALVRQGCGGDTPKSSGDRSVSPPFDSAPESAMALDTTNTGGDGGDKSSANTVSPPVSPPAKSLENQRVTVVGGDSGDNPIEGHHEKTSHSSSTIKNDSLDAPGQSIPVIPAIPAEAVVTTEITSPEGDSDPWEGAAL